MCGKFIIKSCQKIELNVDLFGHDNEKSETCGIKYKFCNCFLEYINFKDDSIEYRCLCSNKNFQKKFDEILRNDFLMHIFIQSFNHDNIKFILSSQKGVYPYEYIGI